MVVENKIEKPCFDRGVRYDDVISNAVTLDPTGVCCNDGGVDMTSSKLHTSAPCIQQQSVRGRKGHAPGTWWCRGHPVYQRCKVNRSVSVSVSIILELHSVLYIYFTLLCGTYPFVLRTLEDQYQLGDSANCKLKCPNKETHK